MDLMDKIVGIFITLIVAFNLATPMITAVTGVDLTNVNGNDLSWVTNLVLILVFVAIALGVYAYIKGKK